VKFGIWPYTPPTPTPTPTPLRSAPSTSTTPIPATANGSEVAVPNLVGLSEDEARRALDAAGLTTTYVNYQTASDVADHHFFLSIAPGHVLSQSLPPSTIVPRGTKVLFAVRKE
jgi:beta-lactam-binding protein with PASTA domain